MRKALGHIMLVVALSFCVMGCHSQGKVIPKSKMVLIYADMLLADQWLSDHADARTIADTTLFYEPIFRKYGYTTRDYDASITYYIDRPDKFNKVIQKTAKLLNNKFLEYNKIADKLQVAGEANRRVFGYKAQDFRTDSTLCLEFRRVTPDIIIKPDSLIIDDASRGDSLRTDQKPPVGEFIRHKPAPHPRKTL